MLLEKLYMLNMFGFYCYLNSLHAKIIFLLLKLCSFRKYPYCTPSPWRVIGNSKGEGISKAN